MPEQNTPDPRHGATQATPKPLSQFERIYLAIALESIVARVRAAQVRPCANVHSQAMTAADLLLVADSLRMDADGDDIELAAVAAERAREWPNCEGEAGS